MVKKYKIKKISFKWRLDIFFQKKKYIIIYILLKMVDGILLVLRTPEEIQKKLLNFAHHYEFEESGLKIEDIKKIIIKEKRVIYDHNADKKEKYKWSGKSILKKLNENSYLNIYLKI